MTDRCTNVMWSDLVERLHTETQQILARMGARWQEPWEPMDQRTNERRREVIQAIHGLRTA